MRNTLLLFIFIISSFFAFGQAGTSILYEDQFGQVTLTYNGLVNGKHSYLATDGTKAVWSTALNRWNLLYNNDTETLYYSNVATAMNPPHLSIGNWVIGPNSGSALIKFQGTGTTTTVLPIELLHFNAITEGTKNLLTWATASESNNKGFDIERSYDGVRFEKIGFVKGNGTTIQTQKYSFNDKKSPIGITYYRLKQLDFDGHFEYSKIISIAQNDEKVLSVYPNPSNNVFTLRGLDTIENEQISIINSIGQTIAISLQNDGQVDLSAYPFGIYYLHVVSSGQLIKLVKE